MCLSHIYVLIRAREIRAREQKRHLGGLQWQQGGTRSTSFSRFVTVTPVEQKAQVDVPLSFGTSPSVTNSPLSASVPSPRHSSWGVRVAQQRPKWRRPRGARREL